MVKFDLTGQTFDTWNVTGPWERKGKRIYWHCECFICGAGKVIEAYQLKNDLAGACRACVERPGVNRTHGKSKSPEYRAYQAAKTRCTNPRQSYFEYWSGRGIEFRFSSFEEFLECVGPKPGKTYTLDRKDNDGHYEPGNVRWVTLDVQSKNKRAYKPRQKLSDILSS